MALTQDLINQFAKLTNNNEKKKEVTVKGTYKMINNEEFVQIDGSDIWTPVTSTVEAKDGERVNVMIKDHTATITGNISSPSARTKSVQDLKDEVDEYGNTIQQLDNSIKQQGNSIIQIDNNIKQVENTINQHDNTINQQGNQIQQIDNTIKQQGDNITSMNNTITQQGNQITEINNTVESHGNVISQHDNTITQHDNKITQQGNTIEEYGNNITLFDSQIKILNSGFVIENGVLKGLSEVIVNELETDTLNAKYANIDFTNINYAAVQKIFSESGIIKDLIVSEGKITGELVGVTIKGDLIEGNTVKADKLVVKGEDGLYYKLNIDSLGEAKASSDEKYQNGLDGSVIIANSIVAEKISVDDLVAFGATIGGFNISKDSIYSGAKNSVDNTTQGIYIDKTGQFAIGDSNNFIKYFLDAATNTYKLSISAGAITTHCYSKTETDNKINNKVNSLKVGGRNLVLLSNKEQATTNHYMFWDISDYGKSILKNGDTVTISFDVKSTIDGVTIDAYMRGLNGTTGTRLNPVASITNIPTTWKRVYVTVTIESDLVPTHVAVKSTNTSGVGYNTSATINAKNIKVEVGNKNTDWTPSPEDVDSSITNAQNTADNAQSDIDNLNVGGRNLLRSTSNPTTPYFHEGGPLLEDVTFNGCSVRYTSGVWKGIKFIFGTQIEDRGFVEAGDTFTYSIWGRTSDGETKEIKACITAEGTLNGESSRFIKTSSSLGSSTITTEWKRFYYTFTVPAERLAAQNGRIGSMRFEQNAASSEGCYVMWACPKLEKGNKPTDWTPSPEDIDESILNAQSTADNANTIANNAQTSVAEAHSIIQQLSDMITNLVTDENGTSLMTQTSNGWTFNMSNITGNLTAIQEAMSNMKNEHSDTNNALEKLTSLVNDVANKTAYIVMATDENGDPCIELGKSDNPFKVRITNTAIDFLEGSAKIAYANNNTFYTEKLIVKNELQIGEGPGFVWRTRANGNMGLVYISG